MSTLPTVIGLTTATKLETAIAERIMGRDGNWTVVLRYSVEHGTAYSQAPAWGDAIPSPYVTDHPNLICTGVTINPIDAHNSMIAVTYEEPSGFILIPGGSAIRSSRAAMIERSVDENSALSSAEIEALKAKDRRTMPYFTVSYVRRSVESSFTWSQANVISGVGAQSAPTGLSSPTANAWLKTERNATELASGGDVELEEVWTYDENLWNFVT